MLRAVAEETRKWEEREARWVQRLRALESKETSPTAAASASDSATGSAYVASTCNIVSASSEQQKRVSFEDSNEGVDSVGVGTTPSNAGVDPQADNDRPTSRVVSTNSPQHCVEPAPVHSCPQRLSVHAPTFVPNANGDGNTSVNQTPNTGGGGAVESTPALSDAPLSALSTALLAQHLPPIPNFNGENLDGDGEAFSDWLERLELVAAACRWDDQTKLVNLVTRLRSMASRFYRTCTPQQRSNYQELVSALRNRFTPEHIQSVHSSIFHERKQRARERVDNYAQDLRKLFHKAYANTHGSGEAEALGRCVLSNQFVAGLVDKLKSRLVGRTGTFEELLAQARFEEARLSMCSSDDQPHHSSRKKNDSNQGRETGGDDLPTRPVTRSQTRQQKNSRDCFSCKGTGHFARDCPLRGRGAPVEAPGKSNSPSSSKGQESSPSPPKKSPGVGLVRPGEKEEPDCESAYSGSQSPVDPVQEALRETVARMRGNGTGPQPVGPVLTSEVRVDDSITKALLDTGSPVSIISLDYFLKWHLKRDLQTSLRLPGLKRCVTTSSPLTWFSAVMEVQSYPLSGRSLADFQRETFLSTLRCRFRPERLLTASLGQILCRDLGSR